MFVHYKIFKSKTQSWPTLFNDASAFANQIGEQRLINISHSCDQLEAVVVVWFWDKEQSAIVDKK
jgi:hypothetical protein